MSYEGFERCLCRNGHLHQADCYDSPFTLGQWDDDESFQAWSCPDCGEPMMWWEQVDQTNDAGTQTALLEHRPAEGCRCRDCGHQHQRKPPRFCCPENRRARAPEPLVPVGQRGYEVIETGEVFDTPEAAGERLYQLHRQQDRREREFLENHGPPVDVNGDPLE